MAAMCVYFSFIFRSASFSSANPLNKQVLRVSEVLRWNCFEFYTLAISYSNSRGVYDSFWFFSKGLPATVISLGQIKNITKQYVISQEKMSEKWWNSLYLHCHPEFLKSTPRVGHRAASHSSHFIRWKIPKSWKTCCLLKKARTFKFPS